MKQRTQPNKMCKVAPTASSKLIDGLRQCKSQKGWLNCVGVSCMPFCCVGIACLSIGAQLAPVADALEDVVNFYEGQSNVRRLATKVYHEKNIFMKALNSVNATISPNLININLTLLDCIISNIPKTGRILNEAQYTMNRFKSFNSEHNKAVWDMYQSMGGDYKVIVYGLIEYLCQIYDPTSQAVMHVVKQLNENSPLRFECQLHKC